MERRVNPREAAQWTALVLGFLIVWPWVRRITPPPSTPGAEDTPCGPGRARTDGDVCRIVRAFGRRSVGTLWVTYNLPQLVTAYLADDDIDEVNAYYSAQGINYRF